MYGEVFRSCWEEDILVKSVLVCTGAVSLYLGNLSMPQAQECFLSLVDTAKHLPEWKKKYFMACICRCMNQWSIISSQESFRLWCLSLSDTCIFSMDLLHKCPNIPLSWGFFFSKSPPWSVKIIASYKGADCPRRPPSVLAGLRLTTRGSFTLKQSILKPVSCLLAFLAQRRF